MKTMNENDRKEITDVIYDKLMHNTEKGLDLEAVTSQEVQADNGYIYFDYADTKNSLKRVHIHITVEDITQ